MELLRWATYDVKFASAVPLAVAVLIVLLLAVLRLLRRGPTRYWLGPSFLLLALIPLALGAALSGWLLTRMPDGSGLAGVGSLALRAAVLEVQLPLLAGLLGSGLVLLLSLPILGFSTSSASSDPPDPARLKMPLVALTLVVVTAALLLLEIFASRAVAGGSAVGGALAWATMGSGLLIAVLLFTGGILLAGSSPRTTAPAMARKVSLGGTSAAAVLCIGAFLGGLTLTERSMSSIMGDDMPPMALMDEAEEMPAEVTPLGVMPLEQLHTAAASPEPLRVDSGDVEPPRKLEHVDPVYPDVALRARVEGAVVLECTISPDGRVNEVTVVKGHPLLQPAAIDAVRQWVFAPTRVDGVPVPVIMTVTVRFGLS